MTGVFSIAAPDRMIWNDRAGQPFTYRPRPIRRSGIGPSVLGSLCGLMVTGEDWIAYLSFQARLHRYSPNNVLGPNT